MPLSIPLLFLGPAVAILFNLLWGGRQRSRAAGWLAGGGALVAFAGAVVAWWGLRSDPAGQTITIARWLHAAAFQADWAVRLDTLSVTMALVVTGVGWLVHMYAIDYMRGDPNYGRFFIYLNLFLVAMLTLVMADNYLVLFVGWEGVGLCSYLLISFWFDEGVQGLGNARAGRKAFIVNRIGDAGFILALTLLFWNFGSLDFDTVFSQAPALFAVGAPLMTVVTLLLFLGATGKSAQIPLFIWLPDAMAGPTPVSALIHAATMVTAGIYLIARSHVLFALAPFSQEVVALTGAVTALVAASVAIAQFDMKRVLAFSTISQLGFMISAVGLGAYTAGLFHLITHAFFKALLFLGAGAVVHSLSHHRPDPHDSAWLDMRQMGGLARRMPVTGALYVIAALALVGVPPLAGFFSKDEILAAALAEQPLVFYLLLLAAFGTAFYMGRQLWLVFGGSPRSEAAAAAREPGWGLRAPLLALAVLAILGGGLNLPGRHSLGHWLARTWGEIPAHPFSPTLAVTATGVVLLGLLLAYWLYGRRPAPTWVADPLAASQARFFRACARGWGVDDAYQWLFQRTYAVGSRWLARLDDEATRQSDSGLVRLTGTAAAQLRRTQTGQLNWNMVGILVALILVTIYFLSAPV